MCGGLFLQESWLSLAGSLGWRDCSLLKQQSWERLSCLWVWLEMKAAVWTKDWDLGLACVSYWAKTAFS